MKLKLLITAVALGALSVSTFARDESRNLKAAIQSEMDQYCAATKKKDFDTMEKIVHANFAKDYKTTDINGQTLTRDEWMSRIRQQMHSIKDIKQCDLRCESIQVKGDQAIASESIDISMTIPGKSPKKFSEFRKHSTMTVVFAKANGKWLAKSSKTKTDSITIDGKKIAPRAASRRAK